MLRNSIRGRTGTSAPTLLCQMEKPISSKIVYDCPVFKIEEAEVELPSGRREMRWYVVKDDAVGIVPINAKGQLMLLEEYRSAAGKVVWWIPTGVMEAGELPEETARRELREEIGLNAHKIELLFTRRTPDSIIKQDVHYFMATDLYDDPLDCEDGEFIQVRPSSPEQALKLIAEGKFSSNMSQAILEALKRI